MKKGTSNQPPKSVSTKTPISELFKGRYKNTTKEHLGTTSLIFSGKQSPKNDDSSPATVKNLNRKKGKSAKGTTSGRAKNM